MTRSWKQAVVCAAMVFSFCCAGIAAFSQNFDPLFAKAESLEQEGRHQEALNEYNAIVRNNQANNPEAAAEALYRGGLYAQDPKRFSSVPEQANQGVTAAANMWRQIAEQFKTTAAFKKIFEPLPDFPVGRYPALLEKSGDRQAVLKFYAELYAENRDKDKELAARALLLGGLFSKEHPGPSEGDRIAGRDTAYKQWRQLRDEFPKSQAFKELFEPRPDAPEGLFIALEQEIDRQNSRDWKYQIMHALVRLTGSNPTYSYGLALILLAILVKLLTYPLTKKQYASMREMQRMQPLVEELKKRYSGAELNTKVMEAYKAHGVNPFASCLPTLVQIPFLIGVYHGIQMYEIAFGKGSFLWIGSSLADSSPNLMGVPVFARNLAMADVLLCSIYMVTQYITMKLTPAQDKQQQQTQNMMAIMMSVMFFWMFLTYRWSSAFVLYWLTLNILSIYQQYVMIVKPQREGKLQLPVRGEETFAASSQPARNGSGDAPATNASASAVPVRVRPRKKKTR